MAIDTQCYLPQTVVDENYIVSEDNILSVSRFIIIVEEDLVDKIEISL